MNKCTKFTFFEESEALTPQSLANSTFLLVSKVVNTTPPVQRGRDNIHNRDFNLQKFILSRIKQTACTVCGKCFGQNVKCVAPKNVMLEASQWFTFQYFAGSKFVWQRTNTRELIP